MMRRYKFSAWGRGIAAGWLLLLVAVALLAPMLPLPYPPAVPDLLHLDAPPGTAHHWLGTDPQGLDVLTHLLFGTRTAVFIILPAALMAALLGAALGSVAGFWGNGWRLAAPGWLLPGALLWWALALPAAPIALGVAGLASLAWLAWRPTWLRWPLPIDAGLLGLTALLGAVPRLLLVLAVASRGTSAGQLVLLLGLLAWPELARLVRADMRRTQAMPFLEAARALGLPEWRIWWHHALPEALQSLRTAVPLSVAGLLGLETTLSYLGVGLPPTEPSWGRMLAVARQLPANTWATLSPLLAVTLTLLALQQLADKPRRMASHSSSNER